MMYICPVSPRTSWSCTSIIFVIADKACFIEFTFSPKEHKKVKVRVKPELGPTLEITPPEYPYPSLDGMLVQRRVIIPTPHPLQH